MRLRRECGVWECFAPGVGEGALYKFELITAEGERLLKADPYAFCCQLRPDTASVVQALPPRQPMAPERARANRFDQPMSVYEVHLGSWRQQDGWRWLSYRQLAEQLVPYAVEMGFTHLELLPVSEHPFDGSWGYQPVGLFAPTARFGSPEDFAFFVQAAHDAGLGVILDWVPAHFPTDSHGLARFDGTHLYEHADPREGFHPDWNTLIYNFGRTEVRNFLIGNALFWLERYGVDGLRVDAVASMLYRDYSRAEGQWVPNRHGGRENLEAIAFLRQLNHTVGVERDGALMVAEESTAFPGVSRPPSPDLQSGGLGFHYKWNMGWMHDSLQHFGRDPGAPPAPPRRGQLQPGLRVQRKLRAALFARRGGARQGFAAAAHAGPARRPDRLAALCRPARALRLSVGPPGQGSCSSWAASSPSPASGKPTAACPGTCWTTRATPACSAWCATSTAACATTGRCTNAM